MTGPEHYKRAEGLLDQLRKAHASMTSTVSDARAAAVMAEAQVHATLALAAANAEQAGMTAMANDIRSTEIDAWFEAITPDGGKS